MSRRRRALLVLTALLGALFGVGFGFRTWLLAAPAQDAPVIGLSIGDDLLNDVGLHQAAYQAVITRLGGRAVEYSPDMGLTPEQILDRIDALVLTGGGDVDPALYGQPGAPAQLVDSERDAFEAELIRGAIARDMPVLAVCRGHQLMNVALGGTVRDIRDQPEVARVHGITPWSLAAHPVSLAPGSLVARCAGVDEMTVNSFHGQVLDRLAPGLRVTAVAPDGVVEAIEVAEARFALGIQWHPELKPGDVGSRRVFEGLLDAARAYRE